MFLRESSFCSTLAEKYDLDDDNIDGLLDFLGIEDEIVVEEEEHTILPESQREKRRMSRLCYAARIYKRRFGRTCCN